MMYPRIVAWETTRRCDLACRHCRAAAGSTPSENELSTPEGLRLIEALAALPAKLLILTGGEPMLREDVHELARAAADSGIRVVMAPCGPRLNKQSAVRLKDCGISAVSISLDAATAEAHDSFRGIDGAFDAALRGLRCARDAGLAVRINTTVSRLNAGQLPAILELAEREAAATLDFFFLVPTGRGTALKDLQLDAVEMERTLAWIAAMDGTRSLRLKTTCAPQIARVRAQRGAATTPPVSAGGCMAGRGFLFVSHVGTVQPCGFLNMPCGDVRASNFDLRNLLAGSRQWHRLAAREDIGGQCGSCKFLRGCGGCRARAVAMSGNALGEEPFCVGDGTSVKKTQARPSVAKKPSWPAAPSAAGQVRRIVLALQKGIPLEPRPFATLAQSLQVDEEAVLTVAQRMLADGSARRFGAVFDARRLGYRSELRAMAVADAALEKIGAVVAAHDGVTHCYQRAQPPNQPTHASAPPTDPDFNLWFTLAALKDRFDREVDRLQTAVAPYRMRRFPAVRRFKIDVIFDMHQRDTAERVPGLPDGATAVGCCPEPVTEFDRRLVRALQGNLPVRSDFFQQPATDLGQPVERLLERLRRMRQTGALRRVGMIVRHRRIGFVANAMCIWPVPESDIVATGRRLAEWSAVTHCYQRVTFDDWPYTLYAMIHTADWPSTRRLFERISDSTGLTGGRMLGSIREFKKTSMRYFAENDENA